MTINTNFLIYEIIAAVVAITIHGFVKAFVSSSLGDPLPKRDKRVTLNPIRHIEPIGLIIMIAFGFGWSKPVENAPIYYKDKRKGTILTYTIAPIVCLLFGVIIFTIRIIIDAPSEVQTLLWTIAFFNIRHAFFNIIPIYPLDGAKVLSALRGPNQVVKMVNSQMFMQFALVLAVLWGLASRLIDPIVFAIFGFIWQIF